MGKNKLKMAAVCGHGLGTSVLMKMLMEDALKKEGIEGEIRIADITEIKGFVAMNAVDVIIASPSFKDQLSGFGKPLILLDNFLDKEEARKKLKEALEQVESDG